MKQTNKTRMPSIRIVKEKWLTLRDLIGFQIYALQYVFSFMKKVSLGIESVIFAEKKLQSYAINSLTAVKHQRMYLYAICLSFIFHSFSVYVLSQFLLIHAFTYLHHFCICVYTDHLILFFVSCISCCVLYPYCSFIQRIPIVSLYLYIKYTFSWNTLNIVSVFWYEDHWELSIILVCLRCAITRYLNCFYLLLLLLCCVYISVVPLFFI